MQTLKFRKGQQVRFVRHGVEITGTIHADRQLYAEVEPSYCDSQEVMYKSHRKAWAYNVMFPIVNKDGTFHTDRNGKPYTGLAYIETAILSLAE